MTAYIFKKNYGKDKNGKPRKAKTYTAVFQCDWMPEEKRVPLGVTDKQVARQRLQELIAEEEKAQYGAVPRGVKESASIPLHEHLNDFIETVRAHGRTEKHLYYLNYHCNRIIDACNWKYPQDISLYGFEQWRAASPLSGKTKNHYLGAFREFCSWLIRHERILKDPLTDVTKVDTRRLPKLQRRALSLEQLKALLAVLPERLRCIVLLAVYTGLRRNEISKLKWADLRLDQPDPVVIVPAAITKNGNKAVIPLRSEVVAALEGFRKQAKSDLIFGTFLEFGRLRKYWLAAGIPAHIGSGYDFHSLRVTFGTMLGVAGTAPRVAQEAMRHSDSRLTEFVYTDAGKLNIRAAIEALPSVESAAAIAAVTPVKRGETVAGTVQKQKIGFSGIVLKTEENLPKLSTIGRNEKWRRERDSNPRYP